MKQEILTISLLIIGVGVSLVGLLLGVNPIEFLLFTFGFLDTTKNMFRDFLGDMYLFSGIILIIFGVHLIKRRDKLMNDGV